jgi:hypothetical protein
LGEAPFGPGGDDGVVAAPGRYTVRLSAAGRTYTQALTVVEDPRVKVSSADLLAQFRLAREIESVRVHVAQTSAGAKTERARLSATDPRLRALDAIIGGPQAGSPDNSLGLPSQDFASLWYVDGALRTLSGLVESADTAPTADEVRAFAIDKAIFSAASARLRALH